MRPPIDPGANVVPSARLWQLSSPIELPPGRAGNLVRGVVHTVIQLIQLLFFAVLLIYVKHFGLCDIVVELVSIISINWVRLLALPCQSSPATLAFCINLFQNIIVG